MSKFKQYRRKQIAELRDVEQADIAEFKSTGKVRAINGLHVSISEADLSAGSPKLGDKIARNPVNHEDQWLVAEDYFNANFDPAE